MPKKLYVGNLSYDATTDSLRTAFEPFGEITDAIVLTDRETGRSRGFGFVTFAEAEDGDKAIAEMDSKDLDGRPLKVNEARERAPRSDRY